MPEFGYIYVIEAGPYFKIGKTLALMNRVEQIIRDIRRHAPKLPMAPVRFVGSCACWSTDLNSIENALHSRFDSVRAQGEWFVLSPRQLEWIFTQEEIPMWEDCLLWEFAKEFDLRPNIPCPS